MQTDQLAMAHGRHRLRLGENFGVGPDAKLEILRPWSLLHQHLPAAARLLRPGAHRGEMVAEDPGEPCANPFGAARVAARLFLHDALERARAKRDAGRRSLLE